MRRNGQRWRRVANSVHLLFGEGVRKWRGERIIYDIYRKGGFKVPEDIKTAIIGAIMGALSGGVVDWILAKRRERREDKKEKEKQTQEIYKKRPELDIIGYKNYTERPGYGIKQKCDINIFLTKIWNVSVVNGDVNIEYNDSFFNQEEWCCVIYTFKNSGKTDIQCINPICIEKKSMVLFDVEKVQMFKEYRMLNYSTWYEKKLRIGETFTMKVCFHKDCIMAGAISSLMVMGFQDDNDRFWEQPLFVPEEKIYKANMISYKKYRDKLWTESAIKCFREPWLW